MIYQTIQEMLATHEPGVLFTLLEASQAYQDFVGMHWIWCGKGITTDENTEENNLLCSEILRLGPEVLEEGKFRYEKLEFTTGWVNLMMEPIMPAPRLIILGCGHVGQALAALAGIVGFPLIVIDDRPIFAKNELFPAGTQVICAGFAEAISSIDLGENDYIVIVTRGHQYDRICLEKLAGRKLKYIGMIGSKRRVKGLFADLVKEGIDQTWLSKIYSPIGLGIGAETPAEIAVSILAEIIQVKRKGDV